MIVKQWSIWCAFRHKTNIFNKVICGKDENKRTSTEWDGFSTEGHNTKIKAITNGTNELVTCQSGTTNFGPTDPGNVA